VETEVGGSGGGGGWAYRSGGPLQGRHLAKKRRFAEVDPEPMIHEKEGPGQKKSWGELREDVRTIRRRLWTLGFRIPHSFAFKNFEDSTRIYFMCAAPNNRDNCLYAVDIPETCPSLEEHETGVVKFPWVQMLPTGFQVNLSRGG